ncbi:MAG: hypothetical protein U0992_21630 [Planctomycetaceae bacterium]
MGKKHFTEEQNAYALRQRLQIDCHADRGAARGRMRYSFHAGR